MINYDELCKLLYSKFKATSDEIRYWVKNSLLLGDLSKIWAYRSDIPIIRPDKGRNNYYMMVHRDVSTDLFYPEYYFYNFEKANEFVPDPLYRFVLLQDLTSKRNWYDYKIDEENTVIRDTLSKANEGGILRFYNKSIDDFTLYKQKPSNNNLVDDGKKQLWCHSFDFPDFLANPNTFFLLYDIMTVERVFFKKDLNICLEELYGKAA